MDKKDMGALVIALHIFKKEHDLEMTTAEYNQIQEAIDIVDSFLEA